MSETKWVPKAYTVVGAGAANSDIKVGDTVYELYGYDYGLASDDSRATGVPHKSVTLNSDGDYPAFTIPEHSLLEKK